MNLRILACVALAACYAPHPPAGEPCADSTHCPSEQSCIAGTCRDKGTADAEVDAPGDRDGDGILDPMDNCPDVANPDQGNEDGDRFGDVCDPCPIDANDSPTDPDNDGVADPCDPNPTTPGDSIALFEGFHHGVPTTWSVTGGTAGRKADDATFTVTAANHGEIAPPIVPAANLTIEMVGEIDGELGTGNVDLAIGVPYDAGSDGGLLCWQFEPTAGSTTGRAVQLIEHAARTLLGSTAFAWTTGTPYAFALTRTGTTYTCAIGTLGGMAQTVTGTSAFTSMNPQIVIRTYSGTVRARWLLVVASP